MSYRILIDPRAGRHLESLPKVFVPKIDEAILALAENPRPPASKLTFVDLPRVAA